jgi:CRISPR-associated protein Cas1
MRAPAHASALVGYAPRCKGCSVHDICLPRETACCGSKGERDWKEVIRSTVYVTQQDSVVRKTDERLKVTQKTETLLDVPMLKVSQVVVFGRVTVTAATLQALLEHHISVCYLSKYGRYVGRIEPALSKNALLRSAQYRAAFDATMTLALARQIVRGKLTNMRVLLQRANRDTDDPSVMQAVDQLKERLAAVAEVKNLDQLRGLEGAGSALYFGVFDNLLKRRACASRSASGVHRPIQ